MDERFARVVQRFAPQAALLRAWPLQGGISAQVTALEIEQPDGQRQKWIMRLHGEADRQSNPDVAAHEFRLLGALAAAGIAAPRPYHLDTSCAIFPIPYIVMEYIEGETLLNPPDVREATRQAAAHLAQIHAVPLADLDFLARRDKHDEQMIHTQPPILQEDLHEGRIRAALLRGWPPPGNPPVLLHGDFWPGNLLWRDGQLAGVIDWEDAVIGDPLADLSHARLEMLWAWHLRGMAWFTEEYQALRPDLDFSHLPYWDLCAALRPIKRLREFADSPTAYQKLHTAHRFFTAQAIERSGRL